MRLAPVLVASNWFPTLLACTIRHLAPITVKYSHIVKAAGFRLFPVTAGWPFLTAASHSQTYSCEAFMVLVLP